YDIFAKTKIKAHSIMLCEKPLADALGMDLDVTEPTGVMVVDIGADTTEISVISLGGLVLSTLLPYGGNRLDESIVTFMKRKFNLVIGKKTAKNLKEKIGSAMNLSSDTMKIVGRDVVSGLPIEMEIDAPVIYEGIRDDLNGIATAVKMMLEKVPPELAKDIVHSGIYLTGGSSRLKDLSQFFEEGTNIRVNVAEQGDVTVATGLNKILSDSKFSRFGYSMKSRIFS
ncbi:MAG: rod shape-determining protein, partial [Lachnospiraceae bacterium]|nr:rod shape-determining protein [Lachnospiraceae bacterium]